LALNSNRFLNIWICDLKNLSVKGYATFPPGDFAASDSPFDWEGVVADYEYLSHPICDITCSKAIL